MKKISRRLEIWAGDEVRARIIIAATLSALITGSLLASSEKVNRDDYVKPLELRTIKMHYEAPKSEYVVGEPILVSARVVNKGTEIEYYCSDEINDFDILNEAGQLATQYRCEMFVCYADPGKFVPGVGDGIYRAIEPLGSTPAWQFDILECYGEGALLVGYILPVGKYHMVARKMKSDTAYVTVVAPTRSEDKKALAELRSLLGKKNRQPTIEAAMAFHRRIVSRHSRSVLLPRSLLTLTGLGAVNHDPNTVSEVQRYVKELILRFPKHPFARQSVSALNPRYIAPSERDKMSTALSSMLESESLPIRREQIERLIDALK